MKIPFVSKFMEKRSGTSDPITMKDLARIMFGPPTKSGVEVTEHSALSISAVYAAVRIIAETIASLSLFIYKRSETGKDKANDHPLYTILHDSPNEIMDSFTFWETLISHALLWGNGCARIVRDGAGRVIALELMLPNNTTIEVNSKQKKQFRYTNPYTGVQKVYFDNEILHISGFGYDGIKGYSVVSIARESFGLAMATEQFGSQFFGNGTNLGGLIKHPSNLSEGAQQRLKSAMASKYSGLENAHQLMVLEEGMTYEKITMPLEDAQFLETRKFQISEIARWFRVPPHLLADLERATFSNIEHQSIEFLTHTIRPWVKRIERASNKKLLTQNEQRSFFIEFEIDSLLRGDIKSRYEAYAIGRQWGWLSVNDIREKENLNQVEGGDIYISPLNMIPSDMLGKEPPKEGGNADGQKGNQEPNTGPAGNQVE